MSSEVVMLTKGYGLNYYCHHKLCVHSVPACWSNLVQTLGISTCTLLQRRCPVHMRMPGNSGTQRRKIQMVWWFQILWEEGVERILLDRTCHFEGHDGPWKRKSKWGLQWQIKKSVGTQKMFYKSFTVPWLTHKQLYHCKKFDWCVVW